MKLHEERSAADEHQEHRYIGSSIPWYVHLLWLFFFVFALVYVLLYGVPVFRTEMVTPP